MSAVERAPLEISHETGEALTPTSAFPLLTLPEERDVSSFSEEQRKTLFLLNGLWAWSNRAVLPAITFPKNTTEEIPISTVAAIASLSTSYQRLEKVLEGKATDLDPACPEIGYCSPKLIRESGDALLTVPTNFLSLSDTDMHEVASFIKHELRNAVTITAARAENIQRLLGKNPQDPQKLTTNYAQLTNVSREMRELIGVIPLFLAEGGSTTHISFADIYRLLTDALPVDSTLTVTKNLQILQDNHGKITWLPAFLTSLTTNVMQNATRANATGIAVAASIITNAQTQRPSLAITFTDNGVGVADEIEIHGFTFGSSRHLSGAIGDGIGMATLHKRLKKACGGGITIANRVGEATGAVVTATFPLNK